MTRTENPDDQLSSARRPSLLERAAPAPLMRVVSGVLERIKPTTYVEWSDVPDLPESPYRARLTIPQEESPNGVEVREREVVRGEWTRIFEIRCACGKRWFNRRFENVQLCPRCGCAVLLNPPTAETP
jgi:hypothetical protein